MTEYSGIHKRQLFHWLGGDIDAELRGRRLSAQQARQRYLAYLKDDILHGLPVKRPRVPEKLIGKDTSVELTLPIACFTEWALSDSQPHSTRYGRMAFGFSKPWIIRHGGQPVSYFNHTQNSVFLRSMVDLHACLRRLQDARPPADPEAGELEAAVRQARYLLHFAKPFAPPAEKRRRKATTAQEPPPPEPAGPSLPAPHRPATRYFGPLLEFLEEREWRIVRHDKPYFLPDPAGRFDSRLHFDLGTELFTLLLPDNELVKMVWQDDDLRKRLLEAKVPVTVVSFTDIGTF